MNQDTETADTRRLHPLRVWGLVVFVTSFLLLAWVLDRFALFDRASTPYALIGFAAVFIGRLHSVPWFADER
ncbi:MAG TPA: hypothetical protein VMF30_18835 [Pirellulales bacterium]|nr:hypothetical protein [Pirellulales bacterium]